MNVPQREPGQVSSGQPGNPADQAGPSPQQLQPAADGRPRDFGELAKRLRGRTLDLLAIGLLGAIIVGLGRQAVQWWAVDPVLPSSQEPAGSTIPLLPLFGADGQPVTIEFGRRQARLTRRSFHGSRESALEQLAVVCLERTLAASLPRHPPDETEQALLAALAQRQPWDSQPNHWRVYLTEGPVSLAVGLRRADRTGKGSPPATSSASGSAAAAASGWRVAANAFAFPADGHQQWTIYETRPLATAEEHSLSSAAADRPRRNAAGSRHTSGERQHSRDLRSQLLPETIIPLMSLTAGDGSSVISFRAERPDSRSLAQLRLQFERAATRMGGTQVAAWTARENTDRAAWSIPTARETYRWEVQLRPDPAGTGITGWASLLKAGSGGEPSLPADGAP